MRVNNVTDEPHAGSVAYQWPDTTQLLIGFTNFASGPTFASSELVDNSWCCHVLITE